METILRAIGWAIVIVLTPFMLLIRIGIALFVIGLVIGIPLAIVQAILG